MSGPTTSRQGGDVDNSLCPQILVIEGLHPFYDDRVADLCDFKIYLDISDEVRVAAIYFIDRPADQTVPPSLTTDHERHVDRCCSITQCNFQEAQAGW